MQTQYTRTTTTLPNATVLPQESTVQITEITDSPSVTSDSSITQNIINTPMNSPNDVNSQTVPSPQVSPTFSSTGVQTVSNESQANVQVTKLAKSKSPRAPKSRTKGIKPQIVKNPAQPHSGHARFQPMQNNTPVIQLQQAQRTNAPTVILQQVASPGIMSYVETLQQQSGQNLQYVTALGGQHEPAFKPQFITTNHLVPGAYIQAPSDNLLALQNGGISILPSVQIAQTQPTVLGTIDHTTATQCDSMRSYIVRTAVAKFNANVGNVHRFDRQYVPLKPTDVLWFGDYCEQHSDVFQSVRGWCSTTGVSKQLPDNNSSFSSFEADGTNCRCSGCSRCPHSSGGTSCTECPWRIWGAQRIERC